MTLAERTFPTESPSRLVRVMGDDLLIRRLPCGTNWRSIRLGVLFALPSNGAWDGGFNWFQVGVCPYNNHLRSEDPQFQGVRNSTLTYNAGGGNPYYSFSWINTNQNGVTYYNGGGTSASAPIIGNRRGALIVSIAKVDYTTQFQINFHWVSGATDCPPSVFNYLMNQTSHSLTIAPTGWTIGRSQNTVSAANTLSSVFYYGDSVQVHWSGYMPAEIYQMAYAYQAG